ncbi:hypothetical protein [Massilia endophytica]|uniref:hypothetical protein n=1 Tax=Massilia endophytica TaxID=2899220 RepID=UPI001E581254|nr:hypothetical protein [Massilia endophytica]UGQ47088.1 hypothetical protein LSQ66_01005 [Massilia endophytica]
MSSGVTMPLRVPAELLEELGNFTGYFWSDFRLEPIICDAIRAYMMAAPGASVQSAAPSELGYQWKELFLPEGTRLRASFGGQPYFAAVEGIEIKYGEQAISPSRFANLQGCGNRNAWKAIWLRLPGRDEWLLADVYRSARKAAIARLRAGGESAAGIGQVEQPKEKPLQGQRLSMGMSWIRRRAAWRIARAVCRWWR